MTFNKATVFPQISKLEKVAMIALGMLIFWEMGKPLTYPDPSFFYFDDFFYYLVPAKHFLSTGSFFLYPSMPTNGFQPLWMGVIVGLLAVANHNDMLFFLLLNIAIAFLFLNSFYQAMALLREQNASPILRLAAGLFASAIQMEISTLGMEVALTVPLLLGFTRLLLQMPLSARSNRQLFLIGFLASMVVLARLDTAILLVPIAIILLWQDRPSIFQMGCFISGAAPIWIYITINYLFMHSWLPISGQAKILKENLIPTLEPLIVFFKTQGSNTIIFFFFYFILAALALLVKCPTEKIRTCGIATAAFLGVLLYYLTYCILSDWEIWFWYMYPLAWMGVIATLRLSHLKNRTVEIGLLTLSIFLMLPSLIMLQIRTPQTNTLYQRGVAVAAFAKTHSGNYAMGDCAGIVSYLSNSPLLQLEGLTGDREFLNNIRNRASLSQVLRHYEINYYVATDVYQENGCYTFKEPSLAGPSSPKMRVKTCTKPLMEYDNDQPVMIFRAQDIRQ